MNKALRAFLFVAFAFSSAAAQTAAADEDDFQSWNDLQITAAMTKKVDFTAAATFRFGKNVSRVHDTRLAVGFVYKANKALSFQPFFLHIEARNANGRFRRENRLNLRAVYRFPVKGFGLSHRSLFEYRLRQPLNSFRYRPSLTFEKAIPPKFIAQASVFVSEEIFYDSLLKRFARNRLTAGVSKIVNKRLSFDVYYMRQNDGTTRPGDLHVVGTATKVRF